MSERSLRSPFSAPVLIVAYLQYVILRLGIIGSMVIVLGQLWLRQQLVVGLHHPGFVPMVHFGVMITVACHALMIVLSLPAAFREFFRQR